MCIHQYFQILDISPKHSKKEIKQRYRQLAKKWHPDRYNSSDVFIQKETLQKMKQINFAYEKIINHLKNSEFKFKERPNYSSNMKQNYSPPPPHEDIISKKSNLNFNILIIKSLLILILSAIAYFILPIWIIITLKIIFSIVILFFLSLKLPEYFANSISENLFK